MTIQETREERRSFYVGKSKEHGIFSIASAEALDRAWSGLCGTGNADRELVRTLWMLNLGGCAMLIENLIIWMREC